MDQEKNKTSHSDAVANLTSTRKHQISSWIGAIIPVIAISLFFFQSPISVAFGVLMLLSIIVAVAFLFIKKYRKISIGYLLGILTAVVGCFALIFLSIFFYTGGGIKGFVASGTTGFVFILIIVAWEEKFGIKKGIKGLPVGIALCLGYILLIIALEKIFNFNF
jgi:hypothetical protein